MSALTRLSLRNRSLVALISIAAAVFGLLAIPSLKQQLIPSLEFPAAFITATYTGAAPDVVETQVVEPIEDAVRGIDGVTGTTAQANEGFASIQVDLEYGTDIDQTSSRIQTALSRIQGDLPENTDPQVFAGSTDDFLPAIALTVSGDDTDALAQKIQQQLVPELSALDGVRTAEVTGAPERLVTITPKRNAPVGTQAIDTALRSAGTPVPAGSVTEGDKSLSVQVGGALTSLDDLRNLYVTGGRGPVRLSDVATVASVPAPETSLNRTNDRPSLGVSVTMTSEGNAVDISHAVRDKMGDWEQQLGDGAQIEIAFDQAPFIERSIRSLATEGLLGLVMAVIVILVFLLSLRSTLVTAVSIPLSVLVALIVMWADGLSLNVLTLGALTIAVGRVVDDSIVVLENIKRHLGYGEEKLRAVYDGAREVSGAITASTLTTVAVFLPVATVGGVVGELFRPFAITVTVALVASLFVALTIVPVLAFAFLRQPANVENPEQVRREAEEKERRGFLNRVYVPVIGFAVRRRWTTVGISVLILIATVAMTPFLKTNFLDQSGSTSLSMTQTLPDGTSLAATDAAATKVEGLLRTERSAGRVESYQTTVGGGVVPGQNGTQNQAQFALTLPDGSDASAETDRLDDATKALTGAGDIEVGGQQGGFGSSDLEVVVQAPDPQALSTASQQVVERMSQVPDVDDVKSDLATEIPRVQVSVRQPDAARAGLTDASIGAAVAAAFRGTPAGQVVIDGVQQDITINAGTPPTTVAAVRALRLPTTSGGSVPIGDVADVTTSPGPVSITRIDGARSATVTGTPSGDNLGAASRDLTKRLKDVKLPTGASYSIGGATQNQQDSFRQLGLALLAAIVIVFVVMVAAFRSLVQPLILLVSIPFAATGALLLLLVSGTALGVPALIGMLMLIGIVVTNAIVLLDLINQYRRDGMPLRDAVVEGGRHRLRPILMTALATVFALLPMAVGLTGEGGFISQPLAVVVIGGLVSSTLLTLVLVPALYTLVEGGKERRAAKRAARSPDAVEEPQPQAV